MNTYEAVVIFTEKFNDELAKKAIARYATVFRKFSPTPATVNNMGMKKLAYPIREQKDGWYIIFKFEATPDNIAELERLFRIDDDVLKFIVVKQEDDYEEEFATIETQQDEQKPVVIDAEDVLLGLATY